MDDVQTNLLVSYRSFDPERDDIRHWTSGSRRLVPDEAADQQILTTLECKLPEQFGALLHHIYTEVKGLGGDWKNVLRSFLNRVTGGENKFLKAMRLRSLSQKEGEPIRQFVIRMRKELRSDISRYTGTRDGLIEGRVDSEIGTHRETLVQEIKVTLVQAAKGTLLTETKGALTQEIRDVLVQAAKEILISGVKQNLPFKNRLHTALRVEMEEMKGRTGRETMATSVMETEGCASHVVRMTT